MIPDELKLKNLAPRERVIVFVALILFWLLGMQAIWAIDGTPSIVDGRYFLDEHGDVIEVGAEQYETAVRQTARILLGGAGILPRRLGGAPEGSSSPSSVRALQVSIP